MKKRFIENLAFFAALNLLIKPIYVFGIDRVVQNTVGTTNYGAYFPLFNLVLIFQIFLDLGIENFTRKELSHNPGLSKRLLSNFLVIKLFLIAIFILFFSSLGYFLPHESEEWKLLVILIINQSMASFILFLRANMGGMHLFKAESFASVLDRFSMILICGTLLLIPLTKYNFKIQWFVFAQFWAYLITVIFSLIIVLRKMKNIKLRFNPASMRPILRQLKPYATLVLLMAFYYRVDSIFLRYLLPDGKEQAGIYAHGFRIIDFMSNYALIFSFILLPTFSQMLRKKENITPLLRMAVLLLLIPSIALLTGISFYRAETFRLLYPGSTMVSANVFLILTISFIAMCFSYTFGALLTANGNLKELNRMALVAVLLSIVLNIWLIPKYKVLGASAANAVSQLFTLLFHVFVTRKKFKLKTDNTLLIRIFIFIAGGILVGFLISATSLNWVLGIIIITSVSLIFSFVIGLIKISTILDYVKSYFPNSELSTS